MDAPASVRTRLISPTPPFSTESNDYFFIYVSLIVTVTMLLSSAFLVWRWGLHGLGTHLSVVLAMVLLAFNAYLGARTWADLRRQHREYLKHRLRTLPNYRSFAEKHRQSNASPVWIERYNYCKDVHNDDTGG
ncbi:unnamed protein product [Nippostrongylus brasiliensis]|uniref:Type VI secretion protein n=1 Tax=Nippostrongylus brasiliensis TaxID=27835 RepID=A0A158R299_NIPBR|nr:unnamed protein product [Nippostrongylus brasiliensis]